MTAQLLDLEAQALISGSAQLLDVEAQALVSGSAQLLDVEVQVLAVPASLIPAEVPPAPPGPGPVTAVTVLSVMGPVAQLDVDGEWVDQWSRVRWTEPIRVLRGRDQLVGAGRVPGEATLTVANPDGRYTPDNPRSDLHGKIGPGTLARVALTSPPGTTHAPVTDTWTRTVTNGWGAADSGQAWLLSAPATAWQVASGTGQVTVGPASTLSAAGMLSTTGATDSTGVVTVTAPAAVGAATTVVVLLRSAGDDVVAVGARLAVGGAVTATVVEYAPDTTTLAEQAVGGLSHVGQALRLRWQAYGTRLRIRVWDPAGAEPTVWHATGTTRALTPGRHGLWAWRDTGATGAHTITWDALTITPEWTLTVGEVPDWPGSWGQTVDGPDAVTRLTIAGPLRRLSQGVDPPRSPLRLSLPSTPGLTALWSMEDATEGTRILGSGVPRGAPLRVIQGSLGSPVGGWSGSDDLPELGTARLAGGVRGRPPTGALTVWWHVRVPGGGPGASTTIMGLECTGTVASWDWEMSADGTQVRLRARDGADPPATLMTTGMVTWAELAEPLRPAHVRVALELTQTGANISWAWALLPQGARTGTVVSGTITGRTIGRPTSVLVGGGATGPVSVGHVMISQQSPPLSIFASAGQLAGHAWETTTQRWDRVCSDVGVVGSRSPWPGPVTRMAVQDRTTGIGAIDDVAGLEVAVVDDRRGHAIRLLGHVELATAHTRPVWEIPWGSLRTTPGARRVTDDVTLRNRVTVRLTGGPGAPVGAEETAEDTTGPRGTTRTGPIGTTVDLNLLGPDRVEEWAAWLLAAGTTTEPRWVDVTVDLLDPRHPGLLADRVDTGTDVGSVIRLTGLPDTLPPGPVDLVVEEVEEIVGPGSWLLAMRCAPAGPVRGLVVGDDATGRADTQGCVTTSSVTAVATSVPVQSVASPWVTAAGDLPVDVVLGGVERVRVTAVTGTGLTQTLTCTRGVDGYARDHDAGADVRLWRAGLVIP